MGFADPTADHTDYEHLWLVDPRTGEVAFWNTGIDGANPVDPDELDLIAIDPLPSYMWFKDMADFAEGVSDRRAGQDLARALRERRPFRRFRDRMYDRHPDLISSWEAFRDSRGRRRAVKWLLENGLIDDGAAEEVVARNPGAPRGPAHPGSRPPLIHQRVDGRAGVPAAIRRRG